MGDQRLTEEQKALVEQALPELPRLLGSRFYRSYIRRLGDDEAYSQGCVALCHAARKYQPEKGPFLPFADWWIRHYIQRAVNHVGLMRDQGNRVGDRPGPRAMAFFGGIESEVVRDRAGGHEWDSELRDAVLAALEDLEPQEAAVVRLVASAGMTFQQAAERVGWSRESVRLIYEKAVRKLRAAKPGG